LRGVASDVSGFVLGELSRIWALGGDAMPSLVAPPVGGPNDARAAAAADADATRRQVEFGPLSPAVLAVEARRVASSDDDAVVDATTAAASDADDKTGGGKRDENKNDDDADDDDDDDDDADPQVLKDLMGVQGALSTLTDALHEAALSVQLDLFATISQLLHNNRRNQSKFREIDGYAFVLRMLNSVAADQPSTETELFLDDVFDVFVLCLLCVC
jgi:hypothetical protein